MGNDRGIAGAFDIIEAHLRAKGHDVRRDDSGGLHLACAGVTVDHVAGSGTFVMAATSQGQSTVLAALADLEGEHEDEIDEIRGKLARAKPVAGDAHDSWHVEGLDCSGCDLPCDVLDVLHHCDLGHCDVGGCDVPGCDLC